MLSFELNLRRVPVVTDQYTGIPVMISPTHVLALV